MVDEETVQSDAPDEGTQETVEQQAVREEQEGQLDSEGNAVDSGEQESQGDDTPKSKKDRVQKRIDQLTKQRSEALREAERLREENRQLKQQTAGTPPADDPRPSIDDFDSVEEFTKAHESWARRQAQREQQTDSSESGASPEEEEARDRIENAAIEAADRYPDFDEVVRNPELPITGEMVRVAADTDSPADVLYHLGKNPQEATRLSKMSGHSLVREMGRLEARLETQGGQPTQTKSQSTSAPDPINPSKGSGAKREPHPDELDINEWMRRERQRKFGNRVR